MRRLVGLLSLVIALLSCGQPAFSADVGPLAISAPPAFEGPTQENAGGGVTAVWIERQPVTGAGTLLQISSIDVGSSLDGITQGQRLEGATRYLLEFVRGVGEPLLKFQFGEFEHVFLAGVPAARTRWTATTTTGQAVIGVIYCVLIKHSVVSLQTRDTGTDITPGMYAAIGSIEGVRIR